MTNKDFLWLKVSEEKLSLTQEELAANRTHQTGLEANIQELKKGSVSLEKELANRDQRLQQQDKALKDLKKQQVRRNVEHASTDTHV